MIEIIDNKCDFCGTCAGVCPVNCIEWVKFEDLEDLRLTLKSKLIRPLGFPPMR